MTTSDGQGCSSSRAMMPSSRNTLPSCPSLSLPCIMVGPNQVGLVYCHQAKRAGSPRGSLSISLSKKTRQDSKNSIPQSGIFAEWEGSRSSDPKQGVV